jgi:hypothetical protein
MSLVGAGGPALRVVASTGCSVVGIDVHEEAVTTASSLAAQHGGTERPEFRSTDAAGVVHEARCGGEDAPF